MDIKNRTYRNVFLELGLSEGEIEDRVEDTFNEIFYGENKFFFMNEEENMGYIEDTGNHDVRTEGMSYGMMMCVQLNHKKEFDCIWLVTICIWKRGKMRVILHGLFLQMG